MVSIWIYNLNPKFKPFTDFPVGIFVHDTKIIIQKENG